MVPLAALWLPILVSAVLVFLVSFVTHMVLTYHRADYKKLPAEDQVMEALRKFNLPPGDYMVPCGDGPQSMKDPAFLDKLNKGPVMLVTVMKNGQFNMGQSLLQWFIYSLAVGALAAYIGGRALGPGANYLAVFRFVGATAFIAYAVAMWQDSIWYKRAWGTTLRNTFDGLLYGCVTAGTFGWLWPK